MLKAVLVTPPQHGYLIVTNLDMYRQNPAPLLSSPPWQGINEDGSFVSYLPTPGYLLTSFGFDSFTYKVTDGISELRRRWSC